MAGSVLYFVCGEASGDLHAANLVQALRSQEPGITCYGTGGDRMADAGVNLVCHIQEMNFMGFVEVVSNLPAILKILKTIKEDILRRKPDAVVLVDYPGMNLRLARWLKERGIRVMYYISPQVWAWKKDRVASIRRYVDHLFVILPFEPAFYEREGIQAEFYGHPLLDEFEQEVPEMPELQGRRKPLLALLPGSRRQEIRKILPVFLRTAFRFPDLEPVIACAPAIPDSVYADIPETRGVMKVRNQTRGLLRMSQAALVASGTATLETALAGVPQVVGYKANPVSVWLARRLVNVRYISLVNLILDKPAVKELIQEDLQEEKLVQELQQLLGNTPRRNQLLLDYQDLNQKLGGPGCSDRLAARILEIVSR